MEYKNFILSELIDYTSNNLRDYTYIGIGSAPNTRPLNEHSDQILPVFLEDIIRDTFKSIRVMHFDPKFELYMEYLHTYFGEKGYIYNDHDGMHIWKSKDNRIEIIINNIEIYINHENDGFLEAMVKNILMNKNKLVVQQFTGGGLTEFHKYVYSCTTEINRELYKKNILFDITYGMNCSCGTDMAIYKPFYDEEGNFYNILLYTPAELISVLGKNPKIDEYIKNYYLIHYRYVIEGIQPDYRRRVQGLPLRGYQNKYSLDAPIETIMSIFRSEIYKIIDIFKILGMVSKEKEEKLEHLFTNYLEYDMYKWYTITVNLYTF